MRGYGLPFFFLVIIAAAIMLACGGSSAHIPQSVSVTPATADAQSYPGRQVLFTATAYYKTMPSPVRNVSASWSACLQNIPSDGVSVSTNGAAQCASGATGHVHGLRLRARSVFSRHMQRHLRALWRHMRWSGRQRAAHLPVGRAKSCRNTT